MGRETDRRHLLVKSQCFAQFGLGDQQHAHWCFHNRVWRPKDVKTSENETVDGQNIQTLQHALCWTPAPPNLNVSARVLAKVMLGVWFFSSIGANALQATLTLNFGGEGVVPDRRGLNISSIYGIHWSSHGKTPSARAELRPKRSRVVPWTSKTRRWMWCHPEDFWGAMWVDRKLSGLSWSRVVCVYI
jgi:hypothetical protein